MNEKSNFEQLRAPAVPVSNVFFILGGRSVKRKHFAFVAKAPRTVIATFLGLYCFSQVTPMECVGVIQTHVVLFNPLYPASRTASGYNGLTLQIYLGTAPGVRRLLLKHVQLSFIMTGSALRGKIDKRRPDRAYRSRASLQAARSGAIDHGNHGPFEEE